jgi:hypothetical protein
MAPFGPQVAPSLHRVIERPVSKSYLLKFEREKSKVTK